MNQCLSDIAWALLRMLYRSAQGGPRPPSGAQFQEAYRELEGGGLIEDGKVTALGRSALDSQ